MRCATRLAAAAVAALLLCAGACGGDGEESGGGSDGGAGGEQAADASAAFCDRAAAFQEATSAVEGIATADEMQAAVDQLDEVAAEAPASMDDEFATLGGVLERLVTAMRTTEGQDVAATVAAMQKVLTPETAGEVEDASRNVEAFLDVGCGIDDDAGAATDTTGTPPTSAAPGDPAAVGTDPALGPLATACHGGDMVKCDELYFASPSGSPYEAYGNTCGQRTTVEGFCVDLYAPSTGD